MVKILSQAGISLADMYDVEGSIAGIDDLETRELGIVHEVGATVFSERFRTTFRRFVSAATAQNQNINNLFSNMPEGVSRILGVQVFADDGTRIANCSVSLRNPVSLQDIPIWIFDVGNIDPVRFLDNNIDTTIDLLHPVVGASLPNFVTLGQAEDEMQQIDIRADTTGFGAGTVVLTALITLGFTFTGGVSAFGARVPSW